MTTQNLVNVSFGKLTILERIKEGKKLKARVQCECGTIYIAQLGNIKINKYGCRECMLENKPPPVYKTHGKSKIAEYEVWRGMRQRCNYKHARAFHNYGARGISIDPSWNDFEQFINDMGRRPSKRHSLERVDNDKGYSRENCIWTVPEVQHRNKRNNVFIRVNGETRCKTDWCIKLNIPISAVCHRYKRGWSLKDSLFTPRDKKRDNKYTAHIKTCEVIK